MRKFCALGLFFCMILTAQSPVAKRWRSKISVYDLRTKASRVIYQADQLFEAPNWSPDGSYLLVNSAGGLFRLRVKEGAAPERIALDPSYSCNNDKAVSPDGKSLAISCSTPTLRQSQVFVCSLDGSTVKPIVSAAPSYFHGWSPDGKWLAFVGRRDGIYNLFRVSSTGGPELRLTSVKAYDDGPDYSPDGKWIYFNSDRAGGAWDIWRMPAEGAGEADAKAERVTNDDGEDWFPHPSPDGKQLLFLSFPKGTEGHNGRMPIQLRMVPLPQGKVRPSTPQVVVSFFGGQGTINVNSWSPDSRQFAYVEYEELPARP